MPSQAPSPHLVRAPSVAKPDRRFAILLAAEKLFAQHGYNGVSIRQIAQAADVPLALVGYYFGPKQALFHAIFEHWNSTITQRLAALALVQAQEQQADYLERVVDAFVSPVLRLRASVEGEWYALLMTRGLNEPGEQTDLIMARYFDPMAHAFIDALMAAFKGCTRAQMAWCYQFMLGTLLHHISDTRVARLSGGANSPCAPQAQALLQAFVVGGMRQAMAQAYPAPDAVPVAAAQAPPLSQPARKTRAPTQKDRA
jgi:AcrR family transcriptional regulator